MKILFTNTGPWGTGSATVVDGVMKSLMKKGHRVHVIFPDSGFESDDMAQYYDQPEKFSILKFPVTYNGEPLYTFPLIITDPHPRNFNHAWTFKDLTQSQMDAYIGYFQELTEKVIAEFRPDIIECQHIWIMDHVIKKLGYDYISVAHHSDQLGFRYDKRMRPYAIGAANDAAHILAISDSVKAEVIDLYSVDQEEITVLPNGYDQDHFSPRKIDKTALLKEYGLLQYKDLPIITFAGKISRTKGIDYLLMANKILQQEKEVLLLIFGAGRFEDVFGCELDDQVSFKNVVALGQQSAEVLASFHNIAHLSVMPSRSEGFGISALEAMGCAIPVVASNSGGLKDFVVGSLSSIGDFNDIAHQIIKILEMPEYEYRKLCDASLGRARQYSWDRIVDQRLEIYNAVVSSVVV